MENIWFTADLHLLHPPIIEHANRPISVEEHDDWLIDRINSRVNKKDLLYILGDVTLASRAETEKLMRRINGRKHLILGNHDRNLKNSPVFESKSQIKNIKVRLNDYVYHIVLCHFPIASWEGKVRGSYHFHGHTHGRYINPGLSLDVGVDNNDYYPINFEEAINLIKKSKK